MRPPREDTRPLEEMSADQVAVEAVRASLEEVIAGVSAELERSQTEVNRLQEHIRALHRRYAMLEAITGMPTQTFSAIVRDVIGAASEQAIADLLSAAAKEMDRG